jgi:hypothetical protein
MQGLSDGQDKNGCGSGGTKTRTQTMSRVSDHSAYQGTLRRERETSRNEEEKMGKVLLHRTGVRLEVNEGAISRQHRTSHGFTADAFDPFCSRYQYVGISNSGVVLGGYDMRGGEKRELGHEARRTSALDSVGSTLDAFITLELNVIISDKPHGEAYTIRDRMGLKAPRRRKQPTMYSLNDLGPWLPI